jgi:arylsulfatase A-like enzyme
MFVYPKRFSRSRQVSQNVQLIDVMPTVLELAGVGADGLLMQGDSLVSLIEKRRMSYWNDRVTASEEPVTFTGGIPTPSGSLFFHHLQMIWSRTFKVRMLAERGGAPETGPRIFDIREDPEETEPLDSLLPMISTRWWSAIEELQANNTAIRRAFLAGRGEAIRRVDPAEEAQLRKLGYVE